MTAGASPNFAYLAHHDPRLVALATQAEQHFATDPIVTLFKLRQFGEFLAQRAAAKLGLFVGGQERQQELVDRLYDKGVLSVTQKALFHDLRRVGNTAAHEGRGQSWNEASLDRAWVDVLEPDSARERDDHRRLAFPQSAPRRRSSRPKLCRAARYDPLAFHLGHQRSPGSG